MIQDIFPHKFDNSYKICVPKNNSRIVFINKGKILANSKDFPHFGEVSRFISEYVYLFSIDDIKYFLAYNNEEIISGEFEYRSLREFYKYEEKYMAFAAVTAFQLNNWYNNNRFCGRCGKPLIHSDKERMLKCDDCGNMIYPKISPAIIAAVVDGDRVLLTKYAEREYKRYALIAGFSEVGETLEETVQREVMEEVGLKVKNIKYYKCQPWSFSDTLLVGFFCELDGSDEVVIDEDELSVAEWVNRDDIDIKFDGISLTNEMIIKFKEGKFDNL